MKFARYLDNAQAPEWKRAYIDYRGLKKWITAIRRAKESDTGNTENVSSDSDPDAFPTEAGPSTHHSDGQASFDKGHDETKQDERPKRQSAVETRDDQIELGKLKRRGGSGKVTTLASQDTQSATHTPVVPGLDTISLVSPENRPSALSPRNPRLQEGLRKRSTSRFLQTPSVTSSTHSRPLTLSEILESMSPIQLAFFNKLNLELSKVEHFFIDREAEARARSLELREQLEELKDHRRLFHDAHPEDHLPTSFSFLLFARSNAPKRNRSRNSTHMDNKEPIESHDADTAVEPHTHRLAGGARLDPDEYLHARKQLKRAVSEHYHALEVLNNYRILNITGFRKALKKFEKLTGILVQDVYMEEKVDPCVFASDQVVQVLLGEMEDQFTARFAKGDRKRALVHLRAGSSRKTHHFSTFRTGLALGLAFPALVDGIVRSLRHQTRAAIPSWGSLLYIYGILQVPTLFAFLVGTNLLIWSTARINYVFIFELDVGTRLDHREYFELPCIALATLCWAFWLSFARAGEPIIQPWIWPMIWLLFVVLLLVNPLPVMSRASRWWFLRTVARLLKSGFSRVEFADFWLGDQLCSLAFPLSNIYFIACSYARGFHSTSLQKCGSPAPWGIPFVLGALPLVARFVQSIRRWWDSRLITHLINGGKYFTGIVYSFCYYSWRHNGAGRDTSFIFFCLFGTIYSTYATSWDVLMDWSLLRPHARFMFLRQELLYPSYVPFYYLAIITNVLIRFIWVIYIPTRGPSLGLRTWIAALLEVLRRCQWNVYRLENEHIGNMDQYRITREVPLPYSFDELGHETDAGDEDDHPNVRGSGRSSKSKKG